AEVTAAAADVDAADAGYADSRYLAHRSKLLPRWRADERNGLVYGAWALLSLLMQAAVLFVASGEAGLGDVVGHIAIVALLPVLAFAAGWLTIGVVTRPTLGEGGNGPDGKLVRNPRLGIVICLSTWLVSCWLGNVYLN
ncbi:MAG: hypothetical protein ACRDXX_06915, partial [Stackebrandtia sp.]